MSFFQFILFIVKMPKFWGTIIWFLDVIFLMILLFNHTDQDLPLLRFTKLIPMMPSACPLLLILEGNGHINVYMTIWFIMNTPIYLIDAILIATKDFAFFMPTSPSNFLGYFLFSIFPHRPIFGVFLGMILSFVLQAIVILLCYLDDFLSETRTITPSDQNESGRPITNQWFVRPVFGTHVNPLDDPPPRYSTLNLLEPSDNSSDEVLNSSLPTYEEAVEVEAQLNYNLQLDHNHEEPNLQLNHNHEEPKP